MDGFTYNINDNFFEYVAAVTTNNYALEFTIKPMSKSSAMWHHNKDNLLLGAERVIIFILVEQFISKKLNGAFVYSFAEDKHIILCCKTLSRECTRKRIFFCMEKIRVAWDFFFVAGSSFPAAGYVEVSGDNFRHR